METKPTATTNPGLAAPEQIHYAFPMVGTVVTKAPMLGQPTMQSFVQTGMTLRDYFAAQALCHSVPVFSLESERESTREECAKLARECYTIADAMIAERSKVKP